MGIITSLTRMWLTRSFKGFEFTNEYENRIEYMSSRNLGLYVHIPFCRSICKFCPYCKEVYNRQRMNNYIDYLLKEIRLVTEGNELRDVTSLYFGGGSPALAVDRIGEIIEELGRHFRIKEGIGIELHPSDVTEENLKKLKKAGVSKISIGIQSFQDKFLDILGRKNNNFTEIFDALKKVEFETVAMDFIFALPKQEFEDLQKDIDEAFERGANHIAIYPFINFDFLNSDIKELNKKEKKELLNKITNYCSEKGYKRDSIWTFSKDGKAKYSSMTRDNFLGFGCSATTALEDIFKINTFSTDEYISRIENDCLPTSLTLNFTKRQRMVYYIFWVMYSMKVDPEDFENFFGENMKDYYGLEFELGKLLGFLKEENGIYELTEKGAFYYHHYEKYYTYDYINSMWGKLKNEAFPEELNIR